MKLTNENIDDIMCSCIEGGVTSCWCSLMMPVGGKWLGQYYCEQISKGGAIEFTTSEPFEDDEDGNEKETYILDREKFDKGFELYLKEYGEKSVSGWDGEFDGCMVDAVVADTIVQLALFGEEVYG